MLTYKMLVRKNRDAPELSETLTLTKKKDSVIKCL